MYSGLFGALLVAITVTVVVVALGRRGPWGSAWTLFLVVFLTLWIVALYIRSVGPVYWGIPWVPLVAAGVLLAVLLAAVIPDRGRSHRKTLSSDAVKEEVPETRTGRFFWILILFLAMAIMIGMLNPQWAL